MSIAGDVGRIIVIAGVNDAFFGNVLGKKALIFVINVTNSPALNLRNITRSVPMLMKT